MRDFKADLLADYPDLDALVKKVAALPNIAAWLKSRPVSAW